MPFDLAVGARVEYRYTSDSDMNFQVTDPQGNIIKRADRSLADEGSITAEKLGRYTMTFGNTFSIVTAKIIRVTYRVVPPGGR